jgi:hypothetical protein
MTHIHLACNNYRNGFHQGFVESISIDSDGIDPMLMLVGNRLSCGVAGGLLGSEKSRECRFLRLGHLRNLRILSYTTWVGNWCWDSAQLSPEDTAKVVNYLKRRNWENEGGWVEMGEKWDSGHVFTASDFDEVTE